MSMIATSKRAVYRATSITDRYALAIVFGAVCMTLGMIIATLTLIVAAP